MSGSIFGSVTPFLSGVSQALGFGSLTPVTLGSFVFQQFEVPATISFGGPQKNNVQVRPGGQKQINVFGPYDDDISWTGKFISPDATSRAQQLDALRIAGNALPLIWGQYSYDVLISDLRFEYNRFYHIDYKITCCVLRSTQSSAGPTLLSSITNDLSSALGIDLPTSLGQVSSALQQISPLVSAVSTLSGGSPAALGILSAVTNAQNITGAALSAANGNIAALTGVAGSLSGNTTIAVTLGVLGAAVNTAPPLNQINNYLSRMASNLSNPSTG